MQIREGFIICENSYKEGFLKNVKGILNYTFLTMDELTKKILFDYRKEAIIKISLDYNINPESVKEYLSYIKYIDLFYDHPKLNFLKELYDYLNKNNLLVIDNNFKQYLKTRPISILGYEHTKELDYVISLLDADGYDYTYYETEKNNNVKRDVYKFDYIDDESRFVFNKIKDLLDKGIDINNIKIANYSSEYDFIFHRLEKYYKIPINFDADKNILSVPVIKYLFELIDNNYSFYDIEDKLKEKYPNSIYLKNIINIINSYHLYNYESIKTKDLFKMEIKNISYDRNIYENGIMLVDLGSPNIKDGDYVFVIGFNQNNIPHVFDDDKYLDDIIMDKLSLDTSKDNTYYEENVVIHNLNLNINYIISYKMRTAFESYLPSSIISKLSYNIIEPSNELGICENDDVIMYADALDNYNRYGVISNNIKENIYNINYASYDNRYKGISSDNLKKYLPEVIKLSYSSMHNYSQCGFKYLMSSILYLDKFEKNLNSYLGTYSHKILELSYKDNFNYDEAKKEAIDVLLKEKKDANYGNDDPLTNKEKFFINTMDLILKEVIDFNKLHESKNNINDVLKEFEINLKYDEGKLEFKGFVDKILVENGESTYVTIIDYKTGSDKASLNNVSFGFNLQLPIYAFMIKESIKFNNPIITGFYLQKIGPADYPDFKLFGYTNSNPDVMRHIDNFIDSSDYIRGLSYKKDGSISSKSMVITDDEMNKLSDLVRNTIFEIYSNVREGKFDINPKIINTSDVSCAYCQFKDVCFKKEEDKLHLESKDFFEKEDKRNGVD